MKTKFKVLAAGLAAAAVVAAPLSASAQDSTIAEIAVAEGFDTLVAALTAADLVSLVDDCEDGPLTVFAPTEDAFAAAFELLETNFGITSADLLADTETLTSILTYHAVPGAVLAEDVVALDSATTANGEDITIAVEGDGVVLNGSVNVIATDVLACNGVVHVIDAVLVPPSVLEALTAAPTTTAPPATTAPDGDLPATGSSNTSTALVAGLLLAGGAALIGFSRRRSTTV
jgi:transforming growth factor-beta-induced protein